ncbi:glycine zipper 2TM domain-containing protein [Craterilacuibacter sp. RT1T]|uniref:glycine zipper 2TM domain-containing protein n=1 Tax=Craterilacuibacter sp. RT1T TaxID=2942211 RepID=UPI0020BE03CA|nr:glycine zipper 2TM domain-containing protein [Craterilacuibacter sp. RT1T]MCL6262516.1 glycine zipper 2TM domain-containing protein [Craterilacuibacter sp. RT1T]
MKKGLLLASAISTVLLATGCSTPSDSAVVYKRGQLQQPQVVEFGQIVSVQNVKVEGEQNQLLTLGGTALGGVAGSSIGQGRGSALGAIGGAMLGGLLSQSAQQGLGTKNALELTVRLDRDGRMVSIVQDADIPLSPGQRVRILSGNSTMRVVPL